MTIVMRGAQHEGAAKPPSGQNAHTEGTHTSASGASSHAEGNVTSAVGVNSHAEGLGTATNGAAAHAEGNSTTAHGAAAHAEGNGTSASATNSHAEGSNTTASGSESHAGGKHAVAHRASQFARGSANYFQTPGDNQANAMVLIRVNSDATPIDMTVNSGPAALTGALTNVLTIPTNRGHRFRIEAIARLNLGDDYAAWTITGTIVRGPTGTSARFLGTPVVVTEADAGAATWTLAVSINTGNATNNYLAITATGEEAKTIRWVAALTTTEVG